MKRLDWMAGPRIWFPIGAILFLASFSLMGLREAHGEAPARRFIEALRSNDYFAEALDYLDLAAKDPTIPQEFKNAIEYERGITLLEASKTRRNDLNQREADLNGAEQAFKSYITARERDKYGLNAKTELGIVLMQRAKVAELKAAKPKAKKDELFADAKNKLKEAGEVFAKIENDVKERLAGFPKVGLPPPKIVERDMLRDEYVRAQMLKVACLMESSRFVEAGSAEHKDFLNKAATGFGEIFKKYNKFAAGYTAINRKAECLRMAGDYKGAIDTLEVVFQQGLEEPELKNIYKEALTLGIPCWIELKQYDVLLAKVVPVLEEITESKVTQTDVDLKLAMGKAGLDMLKANEKPPQFTGIRKLAVDEWKSLKRFPQYAQEANAALEQLGAASAVSAPTEGYVKTKTYQEARTKADELLKRYQEESKLLATIVKKNDPVQNEQRQNLEKAMPPMRSAGLLFYRDCLTMAPSDLPSDDVNDIRFRIAYLEREAKNFLAAGQVSEFLARRYPRWSLSPTACQLAVVSYLEYVSANVGIDPDMGPETNRAIAAGLYMVDSWPKDDKTLEVISYVVPILVRQGQVEKATELLNKVPDDSPKKGQLQVTVGQAVWNNYRTTVGSLKAAKTKAVKDKTPTAEIDAKLAENEKNRPIALQILEAGVARMKGEPEVNQATAAAALSLSQIYVEASDVDKSLELLSDAKVGPLTLFRANNEKVTSIPNFSLTTLKTSIISHITALSSGKDANTHTAAAKANMAEIATLLNQQQRLEFYRKLTVDLLQNLALADKERQVALASGIQLFLDQVVSESNDSQALLWAAQVYQQMIKVVGRDDAGKLTILGTELAGKSDTVLEKLDASLANQNDEKALSMRLGISRSRALVKREMGKFSEALDIYEKALADPKRRQNLSMQVEAAETLQEWAETSDPKLFIKAVTGDRPDKGKPENILWGWNKISQMCMKAGDLEARPDLKKIYFESRLQTAYSVFKGANEFKDAKKKTDNIQKAANVIIVTYNRFPDMGGAEMKQKFDDLLKEMQKAQGQALPQGLNAIKLNAPAAAPNGIPAADAPAGNAPPANAPGTPPAAGEPKAEPAK